MSRSPLIKRTLIAHAYRRRVWQLCVCVFVLLLSGCVEQELVSSVDERESMEILVVLGNAGISAEREQSASSRAGGYSILVNSDQSEQAMKVLLDMGFPREKQESIESITRQKGFTPNSAEITALRLDLALGLQVERMLTALPGVIDAKAVVRSHLHAGRTRRSNTASQRPSASIVVRYVSPSGKIGFSDKSIKVMVVGMIPEIDPNDINITLSRVFVGGKSSFVAINSGNSSQVTELQKLKPFNFSVAVSDKNSAQKEIGMILAVACFIGVLVGAMVMKLFTRRSRRRVSSQNMAPTQAHIVLDRTPSGSKLVNGKQDRLPEQ